MKFSLPERLAATHDTTSFENGRHPELDAWLRKALAYEISGRTFVVCERGTSRVVGFYALATGSVERARLPGAKFRKGLPNDVPVILLARLAVDKTASGRGLGRSLVVDACGRALSITKDIAASAILVHAIDDEAAIFYAKFGFIDMPGQTTIRRTMFLALRSLMSL